MIETLPWGTTPWDNMTREEILQELQRAYAALVDLKDIVEVEKMGDLLRNAVTDKFYWGGEGIGGIGLEKARQVVEPVAERYGESIYYSFFRYAQDLLFEDKNGVHISKGWVFCDTCHSFFCEKNGGMDNEMCLSPKCKGVLHAITWADLKPEGR